MFYALGVSSIMGISTLTYAVTPTLKYSDIKPTEQTEANDIATKRTTVRLLQSHYKEIDLNNALSEQIFDRYLDQLDYSHLLFLAPEVKQLREKYGDALDDALNQGNLDAAFTMYQEMVKRRYQQLSYMLGLLDNKPDLNTDAKIQIDRHEAPWPNTEQEAQQLWKERFLNDVIRLELKGDSWDKVKSKLIKRYSLGIRRLTQTNSDDITQLFLNSFTRTIDPHTSYLSPRSAERFQESINLSLEGIGATLQSEDGDTIIRSLVPNAPAAKSKQLEADDKIVGVGQGEKGKIEDVVGWRLDDVVDKIKGKKGTKVRLEIEPGKGGHTKIVTLVRDTVRIEDRAAKLKVDKIDGVEVGVITIPGFYIGLTKDVRKLLDEAKEKKVTSLVVDLRENGGGSLNEAVELSGLFIPDGPIVQVRDAYQRVRVHQDPDENQVYSGPMIVMVDRYSASASEIFAAAMQDYHRAIIVGQQTFGKGTVQQSRPLNFVFDLKNEKLGYLQYTIQKFYRINGGSTQLKGVTPDIDFPALINADKVGESSKDHALIWDKVPVADYKQYPSTKDIADKLAIAHKQRMLTNPEFIALQKNLEISKAREDRKYLSLNLKQRERV